MRRNKRTWLLWGGGVVVVEIDIVQIGGIGKSVGDWRRLPLDFNIFLIALEVVCDYRLVLRGCRGCVVFDFAVLFLCLLCLLCLLFRGLWLRGGFGGRCFRDRRRPRGKGAHLSDLSDFSYLSDIDDGVFEIIL